MRWLLVCCTCLAPAIAFAQVVDLPTQQVPAGLFSPDPAGRARAARRAGELGDRTATQRLRDLLRDEAWSVRAEAARALGRLRAREALRELMVVAQADFVAAVRRAAAEAVRLLDEKRFAATLATSDKPPVRPAPPRPPPPPAPRRHAVLLAAGAAASGLHFTDTVSGLAGVGLRWGYADAQLTLLFPSVALAGQLRFNILPRFWLTPTLGGGAAVTYNNREEQRGSAASAFVGAGLRVGPFARLYIQLDVLANWVLSQPTPVGGRVEHETFSLPILLGAGMELGR